jgi:hypothetical protein
VIAVLFLALLALLITAASLWGVDPRDGLDWRCPNCGLGCGPHAH